MPRKPRKRAFDVYPIEPDEAIEYVIYVRKSSDESSNKQIVSIPRQIQDCLNFAKTQGLTIREKPKDFEFENEKELHKENTSKELDDRTIYKETRNLYIIKEQKTAKEPGARKKWTRLCELIKQGKIRGLLSYSPDRQCRNMVEGGEIIDFTDLNIIDLKYTNFHFDPNAAGKMMLGIWFVFSKQYSDKLSEDQLASNKTRMGRGETLGDQKHGYKRDEERGTFIPDGKNFELLQEGFQIKIQENWSDERIAEYLNNKGYRAKIQGDWRTLDRSKLNSLWTDPFYYGVWVRGNNQTDLRKADCNFVSMITHAEHLILNERLKSYEERKRAKPKESENDRIIPVERDFVTCKCGTVCSGGIPNKHRFRKKLLELHKTNKNITLADIIKPHQIEFNCNKKGCKYKNSIKFSDLEKVIVKKLSELTITDRDYRAYLKYAHGRLEKDFYDLDTERSAIQLRINILKGDERKLISNKVKQGGSYDKKEEEAYQNEKQMIAQRMKFQKKQRSELDKREDSKIFEFETMMKFMKNASYYYKKANYVQRRAVTKILLSNIVVSQGKVLQINPKQGLENLFVLNGRGTGT